MSGWLLRLHLVYGRGSRALEPAPAECLSCECAPPDDGSTSVLTADLALPRGTWLGDPREGCA